MTAYDQKRAETCEWCAKGLPFAGDNTVGGFHFDTTLPLTAGHAQDRFRKCTAPSESTFAESMAARVKELERLLTALGCQFAGVDIAIEVVEAKDKRIAELEADARRLRELIIRLRPKWLDAAMRDEGKSGGGKGNGGI